jgi:hypothetical protein
MKWIIFILLILMVSSVNALIFKDDFTSNPFPAWHKNGLTANFTWDGISSVTGVGRSYQNITGFDQRSNYTIKLNVTFTAISQQVSVALGKFGVNDNYELLFNLGSTQSQIKCIGTICKLNGTQASVNFPSPASGAGIGTHLFRVQQSGNNVLIYADGILKGNTTIQYFNTTYEGMGLWVNQLGESVDSIELNQCFPNWSCVAYAACLPNNTQQCNQAIDTNICGESYTGNYSEFLPQSCVYTATGGSTSASHRGEVMYCDPQTNLCYKTLEEAQGKTAFAVVPAGSTSNPFAAFFSWLQGIFGMEGQPWP